MSLFMRGNGMEERMRDNGICGARYTVNASLRVPSVNTKRNTARWTGIRIVGRSFPCRISFTYYVCNNERVVAYRCNRKCRSRGMFLHLQLARPSRWGLNEWMNEWMTESWWVSFSSEHRTSPSFQKLRGISRIQESGIMKLYYKMCNPSRAWCSALVT